MKISCVSVSTLVLVENSSSYFLLESVGENYSMGLFWKECWHTNNMEFIMWAAVLLSFFFNLAYFWDHYLNSSILAATFYGNLVKPAPFPLLLILRFRILIRVCTWKGLHALMLRKHMTFLILSIAAAPLFSLLSETLGFSLCLIKVSLPIKPSLLWLASWSTLFWLVNHFQHVKEMSASAFPLPV